MRDRLVGKEAVQFLDPERETSLGSLLKFHEPVFPFSKADPAPPRYSLCAWFEILMLFEID